MAGIFISYRRTDSAAIAGRAYDRLAARYGSGSVFLDINDIPPGVDFRSHIASTIAACQVVLVFIGPDWITRLHATDDPVRLEIEAGLAAHATLIPVLIDGTRMPDQGTLPASLQPFLFLNAARLDHSRDFDSQLEHLFRAIDGVQPLVKGEVPVAAPGDARLSERPALPLPDKPSLAVLPFQNMSGDPEQEYFVDGLVEDITTALSRIRSLFVIARNSAFTYKGRAVDVRQVGRDLGVRYVLEGSVRKSGNRLRITGQLIDATNGAHIWADKFDGALDDVFDLQDSITENVAGAIEPHLQRAEIERAQHKATQDLGAHDWFLRGWAITADWRADQIRQAQAMFAKASALDPNYGAAYGMQSQCIRRLVGMGLIEASSPDVSEALRLARLAVETGRDDVVALHTAGYSFASLGKDPAAAIPLLDRACGLNPNSAISWATAGHIRDMLGRPAEAIENIERAMRLSPQDPLHYHFVHFLAHAHAHAGRYDMAALMAERAWSQDPDNPVITRTWIVSLALAGRLEEARNGVTRLLRIAPDLRISTLPGDLPLYPPAHVARVKQAYRMAGMPE